MKLSSLELDGYRCFRAFVAPIGHLEVIAGANGSGKSALFEFLKWLRESTLHGIPPEIVSGPGGRAIFHRPGPDRFSWSMQVETAGHPVSYDGMVLGPRGQVAVAYEKAVGKVQMSDTVESMDLLDLKAGKGSIKDWDSITLRTDDLALPSNRLGIGAIVSPTYSHLYKLKEYIQDWRFYDASTIDTERIRRPVPIEQDPILREDGGNLSAVLNYLLTEHPARFEQLQIHLRTVIPGFRRLSLKARGAPGEMIAFWTEDNVGEPLSLADISDGTLRMLMWTTLCLHPKPPGLVCLDEPEQGLHPRALPLLAALLEGLSEITQVLVATHSSYFLRQFPLENLAVMRKEEGASRWLKPANSAVLRSALDEFGPDELETMHHTDELEALS